MRTTIDFRDDLLSELQIRVTRDKTSLKHEVNACLERALGFGVTAPAAWKARIHHLGGEGVEPGKVWDLVDSLEAEAYVAKRELRK